MKLEIRLFEKIAIFDIVGTLSVEDFDALEAELPLACQGLTAVVLNLDRATLDKQTAQRFTAMQDAAQKPRLLFVSGRWPGAAAKDLVTALDLIATAESDRIVKIFAKEHERLRLIEKSKALDEKAQAALGDDLELSMARLRDQNRKLKYLLKTLGGEIETLKKQRPASKEGLKIAPETERLLTDAKKTAIEALRNEGLVK